MTRAVALLYALTAFGGMILGSTDMNDIYRHMAYIFLWLPHGFKYPWGYFVLYGILLIAPPAVLLFSGIGTLAPSARRIRVFLISLGLTLPFILCTFVLHVAGARTALYVAGPIASILVFLSFKGIPYEKCALWSSTSLLVCRLYMIGWHLGHLSPTTLGSYIRWAECESVCSGLALVSVCIATIRLVYIARERRVAGETFAA